MAPPDPSAPQSQSPAGDPLAVHFSSLFEHMQEGVALHELICDDAGKPVDYRVIGVNPQYEVQTGLLRENVVGRLASDIYGMGDPPYLEQYASVALGAPAMQFEIYFEPLDRHFAISVAPLGVRAFATIFFDITAQKKLELARRHSERKFETVFDLAPDPIAVATPTGEFIHVNKAFCLVTGYSREELVGRRSSDIGIWRDPEYRQQTMTRLAAEGHVENVEFALTSKDGIERHMELSGAVTTLDGAQVVITAARDVTASRLAEAAADAARQELSQYFNSSLDLLCIAHSDGTLLRINPAWQQVLGYPMEELQGSNFLDLVHPEDLERTIEATRKLGAGEPVTDFRNRYRHADGSIRWLEWRSTPDGHGRIFAVARDITERQVFEMALKTAERTAARSREQLLGIAEIAHIGHSTVLIDTGEVRWTPEFFRILGLEPASVVPSIDFGQKFVHPEDRDAFDAVVRSVLENRTSARVHFRIVRPTGEIRQCLATLDHEVDETGSRRLVGMLQDLTDLKRAEDEQRKLEQQVMQSQKLESLGVLAGGIAHDFNNLLTSILGNADLALRELSPASPACAYLEDIEQVSRRAADLCRQMLAYSGKGRFVVQPVSLNDVVREMACLLSVSISKKVVIKYNFFPDIPSVLADTTQLRQVVMNLITNASEAIGELSGVVTLTTGVMDCDEAYLSGVIGDADPHPPGQYVYFEVSDTGCGMDAETLSKIFDPFFTTKFTGRGLGLAAVMGIVRGHKGALRVYSEKRHGTTFKVLLPAHHQPPQAIERSEATVETWRGQGLLLLADDEESIRSMGRRMLEKVGFEVLTAADGREAIDVFQKHHDAIRLVILDMTMPHFDGEACFREMRRVSPQVKVIMTSGYNEQDVISRFVGKGLAGFVQKPYKSSDLLPLLREILGDKA